MTDIKQFAAGRWREILVLLGVPETSLNRPNRPCPICKGEDRFSYNPQLETFFCRGGHSGDCLTLLQEFHNWTFAETAREVKRVLGTVETKPAFKPTPDPTKRLNKLWAASYPAPLNGEVARYLRGRGLSLIPDVREISRVRTEGGVYAAMLAMLRDVKGSPVSLHLTYLENGEKAPVKVQKRLLGGKGGSGSLKGCAVRLFSTGSDTLHVAEGIETAVSVAEMVRRGDVWSACNAGLLEQVQIPDTYKHVEIWSDRDISGTGEASAGALKKRLYTQGVRAVIHYPDVEGVDWLDTYRNTKGAKAA